MTVRLPRVSLAVLVFVGLPATVRGSATWPPIPDDVWAMKEDPTKGITGAVILENRISFLRNRIEYLYRVRILSEAGRGAAEFPAFLKSAYDFDGRTVHRDGTVVPFSEKKDFQTIEAESRFDSSAVTRLVPPGVTGDCVVELRWKEAAVEGSSPLPAEYGSFHQWSLAHRYLTLETTVEFMTAFPWAYRLVGSDAYKPEVNGSRFTLRNLPPVEPVPFSLEPLLELPRLSVFRQPGVLSMHSLQGEAEYWSAVGQYHYKDFFGNVTKGGEYEKLARTLIAGLPQPPEERALALRDRLDGRILNRSALTFAERASRSESSLKELIHPTDLEAAARRGDTSAYGVFLLYLHLAKQAGLKPTVALVTDRYKRLLQTRLLTPFQVDHYLVGVAEAGKPTLWLDPMLRFAGAVVYPAYQGIPALELNTDDWTIKPVQIPAPPAAFNQRQFSYDITLGDDEDAFTAKAGFAGYPEYEERWRFMTFEPKEQARRLKEDIERRLKSASVTHSEVSDAQSVEKDLTWQVEARMEAQPSAHRTVGLFPAMPFPIPIPSALPEKRTQRIVFFHPLVQLAQSTVHGPQGYRLVLGQAIEHSNSVGSVSLTLKDIGPATAEARLRVEVPSLSRPAESYGDLKDFLSWVNEACSRTVTLEK